MTLIAALAFFVSTPTVSRAQQMPDTIFDDPPSPFGNTLLDVPPDIHSIDILTPDEPGKATVVRAVIKTDPILTLYRVKEAKIIFYAAGKFGSADMDLADDKNHVWQGEIPAMEPGTEVRVGIHALDEVGNAVARLIDFDRPVKGAMLDVISDQEDPGIDGSIDVLGTSFASTGDVLHYCHHFRAPFRWSTFSGAAALGLGFYPDDVRVIPAHSITENTYAFVAYVPIMDIKAVAPIQQVLKGKGMGSQVPIEAKGRRVCGRVRISDLTDKPGRGLKVFTGTATFNMDSEEFRLGDSSPYAILYFKGLRYTQP